MSTGRVSQGSRIYDIVAERRGRFVLYYSVTIESGIEYRISGSGREWVVNEVFGQFLNKQGTFTSYHAAAKSLCC
jgi:hypothetical protein